MSQLYSYKGNMTACVHLPPQLWDCRGELLHVWLSIGVRGTQMQAFLFMLQVFYQMTSPALS